MRIPSSLPRPTTRVAIAALAPLLASCGLLGGDAVAPAPIDAGFDIGVDIDPNTAILGPDSRPIRGRSVGETCVASNECRGGTVCAIEGPTAGTCTPAGDVAQGDYCSVSAECDPGLTCQWGGRCGTLSEINPSGGPCQAAADCDGGRICRPATRCAPQGPLVENQECTDPTACERGLRCNIVGFTGLCEPEGTADLGQTCETSEDCLAPLGCGADGVCKNFLFGGLAFMPDAACDATDPNEAFKVYFEVPRPTRAPADFYRLPFPNDARIRDGRVVLDDHPNPGLAYIGGELVDVYLNALTETFAGFSTNPGVYFRFSQTLDFASLTGSGDNPTLRFLRLDPELDGGAQPVSMFWSVTTGRGKFICQNYLAVHPAWGSPLEHGATYAVILTDGLRSDGGDFPVQDADLRALLGDSAPQDADLGQAWESWSPFRAWLAETDTLEANDIAAAAVFTTMDPDAVIAPLRTAVRAQQPPNLQQLTVCDGNNTSPCDDGDERGCVTADGEFIQIHATYQAPVWQRGTRPYLRERDGGDLVLRNGAVEPQGNEQICVSMTIPTGEMPEAGWPVVMYGHGTGGSFTSHIREGVARRLARIALPQGREARVASISIDGVQHGPRRGGSELSAEVLFYNFINPNAARGNIQQGAADYFLLTAMLESLDIPAASSPTGDAIRFDADNLFFFGHSQGVQVGAPFVAYERGLRGVLLSGSGGGLPLSLLNKTQPVNIAEGVRLVLGSGNANAQIGDLDPFLALLQWYVDPVDPLNYGAQVFRRPGTDVAPHNTLLTYGYNDNYSPEPNQRAFAGSLGIPLAIPFPGALQGFAELAYPISGNRNTNGSLATAVMIAVEPNGYDGHFVVFRDAALARQAMEFIGTGVLDDVPTITAP